MSNCSHTNTQSGNPWARLWALGLIVDEASLCVHTSTAGWILLAQAARANNRLTHSHCRRVCVCAHERCRNVTKQLSLFIYCEDVLMLKGQSPAAMLLFVWLALYTATPAAAPPSRRHLWVSASSESAGGLIEFYRQCWKHAAPLPLSMWQRRKASPYTRCWYSDFLAAVKETWHCRTLGRRWQDDISEGRERRWGSERKRRPRGRKGGTRRRQRKEMSGWALGLQGRRTRRRNVLRDAEECVGRECWEISFIWHFNKRFFLS